MDSLDDNLASSGCFSRLRSELVGIVREAYMIPYEWQSVSSMWWRAWQNHIQNAKRNPTCADGYCRAALISQAYYVINMALELTKENSNENKHIE
jgi:hypothetical protein